MEVLLTNTGGIAAERLRSFIERIERLEEEKKQLQADIREVKSEAKSAGFDIKTINEILRLRKMDQSEREEHEALVDIYKAALGMLYDTPLGEAARRRLSGRPDDGQACAREMNATVNALLKRIESFNGTAMAATNRADAIDPAMWRRFGMHLDVALPGFEERYAILRRYLHPLEISDENLDTLSEVTDGASPALIRQLMEGVKRALVLNPRLNRSTDPSVVFSTLLASIKPHQAYTPPPLWHDQEAFDRACSIEWPPTLNKEAA